MAAPPIDCKFAYDPPTTGYATYRDSCNKCIDYQKELSFVKQENVRLQQKVNTKPKTSYRLRWRKSRHNTPGSPLGQILTLLVSIVAFVCASGVYFMNYQQPPIIPLLIGWPGVPFIFMLHMITFEKVEANDQ